MGRPGWFKSKGVSDTPPEMETPFQPGYPDEMQDATEPGYAIIERYLDAQGVSRIFRAWATNPYFSEAADRADREFRSRPAKKDGRPVPSYYWIPVIFNPESSLGDRADATPRLLAVSPVVTGPKPD